MLVSYASTCKSGFLLDSRNSEVPREFLFDRKNPGQLPRREGRRLNQLSLGCRWLVNIMAEGGLALTQPDNSSWSLWQRGKMPRGPGRPLTERPHQWECPRHLSGWVDRDGLKALRLQCMELQENLPTSQLLLAVVQG